MTTFKCSMLLIQTVLTIFTLYFFFRYRRAYRRTEYFMNRSEEFMQEYSKLVHETSKRAAEAIERQRNAVKTNKTLEREIRADLEAERWRRQRNANLPSPEDTLRNLEVNINETD